MDIPVDTVKFVKISKKQTGIIYKNSCYSLKFLVYCMQKTNLEREVIP